MQNGHGCDDVTREVVLTGDASRYAVLTCHRFSALSLKRSDRDNGDCRHGDHEA